MISNELKESALELNDLDKIHLIEYLMDNLERPNLEVEQLWVKESEERYAAYKAGKVQGIHFDKIKEIYSR